MVVVYLPGPDLRRVRELLRDSTPADANSWEARSRKTKYPLPELLFRTMCIQGRVRPAATARSVRDCCDRWNWAVKPETVVGKGCGAVLVLGFCC